MAPPQEVIQKQSNDKSDVIFRSKLPDIYIPNHLSLHDYIFENISEYASKPCLINGPTGQVYTYSDVHVTSRRIASGFRKLGVNRNDVVMILLPNCPEFVLSFLGASFLGVTATAANPFYTPAEIAKQAKASNSKLIITESRYVEKIKDLGVPIVCTDDGESVPIPEGCLRFTELSQSTEIDTVEISPDDVVALPYSSGTTGK